MLVDKAKNTNAVYNYFMLAFPWKYEIIAFMVGGATMALEILAFGIVAPHFGMALAVSSNIIGVVLAGLAVGYYFGGVWADKMPKQELLIKILLFTIVFGAIPLAFRDFVNNFFAAHIVGLARSSFLAIAILLGPINVGFGAMLPILLKLRINKTNSSGQQAGLVYTASTIGSIFGTFFAGFVLIPYMTITAALAGIFSLLILVLVFEASMGWKYLFGVPLVISLFFATQTLEFRKIHDIGSVSDGAISIDRASFKKLADANSQYSRIEVYEGFDDVSHRKMRLMRVNREMHSGIFIGSNDLAFKYAKFNTLAGHFNPDAKKALLVGGGGYSYAKFFLGDTPLYDTEKIWQLNGKKYSNNRKVDVPILITSNAVARSQPAQLISHTEDFRDETEREGAQNFIRAGNQAPGSKIVVDGAEIYYTGLPCNNGFVHVHETKESGSPGKVVSPNIYIHKPRNIIGHSQIITGENKNVVIPLDRKSKEGEVLYPMLHRDNCNGRFDALQVDGYENIRQLDVVEIDPKTTELAEKYFELNIHDPRLRIFHEDGRTYFNRTKEKYDIIYLDAFRSFYGAPFQLTTLEATQKLYAMLNDNGVIAVNIPAALKGKHGKFFQAEYVTYKKVFPEVRVFATASPGDEYSVQNIIMIAFKNKENIRTSLNDEDVVNERLLHRWTGDVDPDIPILTDEFAPVDYYANKLIDVPTF